MNTLFATSPDGVRVAYDRSGTGPAIVMLHGGGSSRQEWHEAGYVRRLQATSRSFRLTCAVMARVACQWTRQTTP
jgi:pimeloyl-ACP methyl ester carboxylesterase